MIKGDIKNWERVRGLYEKLIEGGIINEIKWSKRVVWEIDKFISADMIEGDIYI